MEALLDSVDVAIQRAATGDQGLSGALNKKSNSEMAMEAAGPLKNLTESANAGLAILDSERKIVELNSRFEEITGIRQEFSIGVEITGAARDQAFAALALELIDKAMTGVQGVSETFDFSGVPYRVLAMAFPGDQQTYRGFVLWVTLDG
jgi:PAS domain S-box-containing protein